MKFIRLIYTFVALMVAGSVAAQSVNEAVEIDEKIHDFGTISETAGKVSHRFRFTNRGTEPLVLLRARAGCNCVSASVPSTPIAPGKSGYVTVTFDPEYRPGHFSKEIVVYSGDRQYNRIWVKGDVEPGQHNLSDSHRYSLGGGLLSNYKVMIFGHVASGAEATKQLSIANDSDQTLRLNFETDSPADASVGTKSGCLLLPGRVATVEVYVNPATGGTMQRSILLYPVANGNRYQPIEIQFTPQAKAK